MWIPKRNIKLKIVKIVTKNEILSPKEKIWSLNFNSFSNVTVTVKNNIL